MIKHKPVWSGAKIATFILVLLPVIAFILIVLNLIVRSIPAIIDIGLSNLLSTEMKDLNVLWSAQYGLRPAIIATLQIMTVALLIGFPTSLAMAILASEFTLRGIGRFFEMLLSLFAGIPPIIYGVFTIYVIFNFIRPKLAGEGLAQAYILAMSGLPPGHPDQILPRNNSLIIGGVFLGLLVIPFMAPLILDAIRNVPNGHREASLALGATRWYTLQRVILPESLTGIVAAASLGMLKAMGDLIIAIWAIGFTAKMSVPYWDVFEANAPLTATAAGLLGDFVFSGDPAGPRAHVTYFAALLLLVMAFVVLGVSGLVQRLLQRRLVR